MVSFEQVLPVHKIVTCCCWSWTLVGSGVYKTPTVGLTYESEKYFQFVSLTSSFFVSSAFLFVLCKKYISLKWLRYICYDGRKNPYYKHSLSKPSQEPIRAARRVWGIDKTQLEIAVPNLTFFFVRFVLFFVQILCFWHFSKCVIY